MTELPRQLDWSLLDEMREFPIKRKHEGSLGAPAGSIVPSPGMVIGILL